MQRSSESIACLAAALAKAQTVLTNPEKSLVATIHPNGFGEPERSFRYAPLSSGLEIVRKTLGQHEIATVQTTAIDETAGIVNLTTLLAHSSGEWIASDWPVCPISETVTPHRMGAALTYARRYALFTLVGLAGEDDLDAPDLATPTKPMPNPETSRKAGDHGPNGGQRKSFQGTLRRGDRIRTSPVEPLRGPESSAELRNRLMAELNRLGSSDEAAIWARRNLRARDALPEDDARLIEDAFRARSAAMQFGASETAPHVASEKPKRHSYPGVSAHRLRSTAIDKSLLAVPEPRRVRDRTHVKTVAKQPCLICGRQPSDAHHLRFAQHPALGRKVSDEFTVPLCRGHHREVHRCGDEIAWWKKTSTDPVAIARSLWLATHPLPRTPSSSVTEAAKIGTADLISSGNPATDST